MPQLDDSREALLHAGEDAQKTVKRAWDGFTDFTLRDNVLEVAVGLVYVPFLSLLFTLCLLQSHTF